MFAIFFFNSNGFIKSHDYANVTNKIISTLDHEIKCMCRRFNLLQNVFQFECRCTPILRITLCVSMEAMKFPLTQTGLLFYQNFASHFVGPNGQLDTHKKLFRVKGRLIWHLDNTFEG